MNKKMNKGKDSIVKHWIIFLTVSALVLLSVYFSASKDQFSDGLGDKIAKREVYQTWHEENLPEIMPEIIPTGNTLLSADFYGVEKVVYTKASYNPLSFGLTKDLVIANTDGSLNDTVLQDIPDTSSGASRFILLPDTKEIVLAVPGVVTYQKIDFEKVNLETRERVKLGTYEQKSGVELQGAIVSPDQKKLLFTISGMKIFLMDLDKSATVPNEPIYTVENGMLIPEVWDEKGNVYLSNFLCFPCFPRESEKNTDGKLLSMLQMNTLKKRLVFFRNIESYAFSPDNNYFAWVERQEDDPNMKVKVYSAKEDVVWVVDDCKVLPETLIWRDATNIQYKVADGYFEYANIVYDVKSHAKDGNPIPPSYKVEGKITHDIKIKEGAERGSVEGAKLYIDGVLIDSIEGLHLPYGHSRAFEVLGFIHGKPVEGSGAKPLYPSYLPESINISNLYEYNKCSGVICTMDIVGNFGALRIRQFIDLKSLYFPDDMIDDTATFQHIIKEREEVIIDRGKGSYFELGNLPREKRLYFTKGDSKIQFFCYGGCTLSKEELLKIAESMTAEKNTSVVDTSSWQTYRNDEFGFELRYPKDWRFYEVRLYEPDPSFLITNDKEIDFAHTGIPILSGNGSYFHVWTNAVGLDKSVSKDKGTTQKMFTADTYVSKRVDYVAQDGTRFSSIIFIDDDEQRPKWTQGAIKFDPQRIGQGTTLAPENDFFLYRTVVVNTEASQILDQILSTFRFVEPISQTLWDWELLGCGSNAPCSYKVCSVTDPANCYSCVGKYDLVSRGEKTPTSTTDPATTTDFTCQKMTS